MASVGSTECVRLIDACGSLVAESNVEVIGCGETDYLKRNLDTPGSGSRWRSPDCWRFFISLKWERREFFDGGSLFEPGEGLMEFVPEILERWEGGELVGEYVGSLGLEFGGDLGAIAVKVGPGSLGGMGFGLRLGL